MPVRLEAPSKVSLFVYDNGTFIVHNFRDEPVDARAALALGRTTGLEDVLTGESIVATERQVSRGWGKPPVPDCQVAPFAVPPHSFRVFRVK